MDEEFFYPGTLPPVISYEYAKPGETLDHLIEHDLGLCDGGEIYNLASREDHCVEEGACWDHCIDPKTHYYEQIEELNDIIKDINDNLRK